MRKEIFQKIITENPKLLTDPHREEVYLKACDGLMQATKALAEIVEHHHIAENYFTPPPDTSRKAK